MANRKTTSSGPLAALKNVLQCASRATGTTPHQQWSQCGFTVGAVISDRQPARRARELTTQADQIGINLELPLERLSRYTVLEEMAKSATVSRALNIHLAQALSPSKRTGMAFSIVAKDPGDKETVARCHELMNDPGK